MMRRVRTQVRLFLRDTGMALAPRGGLDVLAQFALMYLTHLLYEFTRSMARGREDIAMSNAQGVMRIERSFGFFWEPWIQARMSDLGPVMPALTTFYYHAHLPFTVGCLIWIFVQHRDRWTLFRNWFLALNIIGVVLYTLLPTAPPRMVISSGVVDMGFMYGHNPFGSAVSSLANPFAAMPSLHFGYAVFVAGSIILLSKRGWVRALWAVYPLVVLVSIVSTGNHFLLDAIAGGLVVLAAWFVAVGLGYSEAPEPLSVPVRDDGGE
jgi:hypothetical protein